MIDFIQTYLPNVYRMGWSGQAGWGTAIYLTLYMTFISFVIGGLLGLIAGLLLVLTAPGGIIENKLVFHILDKITSIFRAIPLASLDQSLYSYDCRNWDWSYGGLSSPIFSCLSFLCSPSSSRFV